VFHGEQLVGGVDRGGEETAGIAIPWRAAWAGWACPSVDLAEEETQPWISPRRPRPRPSMESNVGRMGGLGRGSRRGVDRGEGLGRLPGFAVCSKPRVEGSPRTMDCGIEQSGSTWWSGRGRRGVDRRFLPWWSGRGRLRLRRRWWGRKPHVKGRKSRRRKLVARPRVCWVVGHA
jgi:hypothetical protein